MGLTDATNCQICIIRIKKIKIQNNYDCQSNIFQNTILIKFQKVQFWETELGGAFQKATFSRAQF